MEENFKETGEKLCNSEKKEIHTELRKLLRILTLILRKT